MKIYNFTPHINTYFSLLLQTCLKKDIVEAGCDEAGRGCLAGPVTAAAVIMPPDYSNPLLNDSKKLTAKQRDVLRVEIEKHAIDFAVSFIENTEIDEVNIFKASMFAMHRAIDKLNTLPAHILVDGNKFFPYKKIPHTCVIKGDGKFISIAAASILAKTYRDEYMCELHEKYSDYQWNKNKGYPTKSHRLAILNKGITPYHRRSFQLTDTQMALNFNQELA